MALKIFGRVAIPCGMWAVTPIIYYLKHTQAEESQRRDRALRNAKGDRPIAIALNEALYLAYLAGRLPKTALAWTNVAVCATIDGKFTQKAPDWFYIRYALPTEPPERERLSYSSSQISVMNDLVGATATRATIWAVE